MSAPTEPPALRLLARRDCPYCHGRGIVTDWVDYGSTRAALETECECIWEQVPDDAVIHGEYCDELPEHVIVSAWEQEPAA